MTQKQKHELMEKAAFDTHWAEVVAGNIKTDTPSLDAARLLVKRLQLALKSAEAYAEAMVEVPEPKVK